MICCMIMINNINTDKLVFLFIEYKANAGISAIDCYLVYNANP